MRGCRRLFSTISRTVIQAPHFTAWSTREKWKSRTKYCPINKVCQLCSRRGKSASQRNLGNNRRKSLTLSAKRLRVQSSTKVAKSSEFRAVPLKQMRQTMLILWRERGLALWKLVIYKSLFRNRIQGVIKTTLASGLNLIRSKCRMHWYIKHLKTHLILRMSPVSTLSLLRMLT